MKMKTRNRKIGFLGVMMLFWCGGFWNGMAQEISLEPLERDIAEMDAVVKQHEKLIKRLQDLIAGLIQKQETVSAIEENMEALMADQAQNRSEMQLLRTVTDQLQTSSEITKNLNAIVPPDHRLLMGMLSLQSGNPQQAAELIQPLLEGPGDLPKDALLMLLANGFKQYQDYNMAASYYGRMIKDYPESKHHPYALYSLGVVFGQMYDYNKQRVVWQVLIKSNPEHYLSQEAQLQMDLQAEMAVQETATPSGNKVVPTQNILPEVLQPELPTPSENENDPVFSGSASPFNPLPATVPLE
ncbi:hypothetical protein WDW89_12745 [Deltaproteobacteria bacterium TL4]